MMQIQDLSRTLRATPLSLDLYTAFHLFTHQLIARGCGTSRLQRIDARSE